MRVTTIFVLFLCAAQASANDAIPVRKSNLLNPDITVFFDLGGSLSTNEENKGHNRFHLREVELNMSAAVVPIADAMMPLSVHEEIENPFGDDDETEIVTHFEIEEAFLNAHTLPFDLAIKGGKFRAAFGRNNVLHTHDLPQLLRPLAVVAFLGHEGLVLIGGEVSWLAPNPWDQYIEWTTAVANADGGEESPLLRGARAKNPSVVSRIKWFGDIGESNSLEIGTSFVYVRSSGSFSETLLGGSDVTWLWRDPSAPDSRSAIVQAEFFIARADSPLTGTTLLRRTTMGGFVLAQYQFHRNAYLGFRYDLTELPNVSEPRVNDQEWAASGLVTWYYSESLRFRLELQHLDREVAGRRDSEQIAMLGLTFYIGSHPPHPYWVNR